MYCVWQEGYGLLKARKANCGEYDKLCTIDSMSRSSVSKPTPIRVSVSSELDLRGIS